MSADKKASAFQTIMPVKPGTISELDKALLKEIGVIVIEHAEPETIRLITPMNETDQGTMLQMTIKALTSYNTSNPTANNMREYFGRLVLSKLEQS